MPARVLDPVVCLAYQHNRNPFIDHPEWADCVFLDLCTADRIFAEGFEP